ncbi:hypothetical protein EYF80_017451 [Liparis tanakae]|uniref:Uncharacterized protein n=1 Tax=Liparis tanakae TaxID=230148 RepID=A0A4Z2I2J3_9TELE|nr:hypothetical protein EYF80_017451 [Liparis tanakae]
MKQSTAAEIRAAFKCASRGRVLKGGEGPADFFQPAILLSQCSRPMQFPTISDVITCEGHSKCTQDPWAARSPRPHAMLSFERKPVRIGLERLFHLVIQGLTRFDWSSPNGERSVEWERVIP